MHLTFTYIVAFSFHSNSFSDLSWFIISLSLISGIMNIWQNAVFLKKYSLIRLCIVMKHNWLNSMIVNIACWNFLSVRHGFLWSTINRILKSCNLSGESFAVICILRLLGLSPNVIWYLWSLNMWWVTKKTFLRFLKSTFYQLWFNRVRFKHPTGMKSNSFIMVITTTAINTVISTCVKYLSNVNFYITSSCLWHLNHFFTFFRYKTPKGQLIFKNRMRVFFNIVCLFIFNSFKYLGTLVVIFLLKNLFLTHVFDWVVLWFCIDGYTISLVVTKSIWLIIRCTGTHLLKIIIIYVTQIK